MLREVVVTLEGEGGAPKGGQGIHHLFGVDPWAIVSDLNEVLATRVLLLLGECVLHVDFDHEGVYLTLEVALRVSSHHLLLEVMGLDRVVHKRPKALNRPHYLARQRLQELDLGLVEGLHFELILIHLLLD